MLQNKVLFALIDLCIAVALAGCAQIIGIEDLPPLPENGDAGGGFTDAGSDVSDPDAMVGDLFLVSLSVSGIASSITLLEGVTDYLVDVPFWQPSVTVTATLRDAADSVTIEGELGTSGMPSQPVTLSVGDNPVEVSVQKIGGAQRVYRLTLRRAEQLAQYAYGKASNSESGDGLGFSLALSGDTLAIGAYVEDSGATGVNGDQDDNSAENSGAVYVFRRMGLIWQQEAYLKASNAESRDQFGFSVALFGDFLAVGALQEDSAAAGINGNENDNSADGSGAVYLFRRTGTIWQQEAYIKASNPGSGELFGRSVALLGDMLAVGAMREDSGATGVNGNQNDDSKGDSGAVYVFRRIGTTWQQEAYIKASNTDIGDFFGISVALSDDTLVVGANGEDSNATGVNGNEADNTAVTSGAVYVFRRTEATWQQEAYIKASNSGGGDFFGSSVAISGEILAVGAYGERSAATSVNGNQQDNTASYAGAVYVFRRTGAAWQQEAYIKASNTNANDYFGGSVALLGSTLAVGAQSEDSAATGNDGNQNDNSMIDSGAVYIFRRTDAAWQQETYLKASNAGMGDSFGAYVTLASDTLVVGAHKEASESDGVNGNQADDSAPESGAVYIFH
jgi:hypothetical protein